MVAKVNARENCPGVSGAQDRVDDAEAFIQELYCKYRNDVFRVALRYGRNDREWAADITQDVFVTACHKVDLIEPESAKAWLKRCAINRCLTRLRYARIRASMSHLFSVVLSLPAQAGLEQQLGGRQDLRDMSADIDRLPPKQRMAFYMHHVDELPQNEIADLMQLSRGYVCKLLARAEATLRARGWGDEV